MSESVRHDRFLAEAQKIAIQATCTRARCGTVIVNGNDDEIIATGYNEPPQGKEEHRICDLDFPVVNRKKPKADCTCCVHAEQNAILSALKAGKDLTGSTLYFMRVDEHGNQEIAGEPYCISCSKMALHCGIAYWVLLQKEGPHVYDAESYHDLSVNYHRTAK